MNCQPALRAVCVRSERAFTLVEMMIAVGLASIVLAMVMSVYLFGLRSFAAMDNYAQLCGKSRQALDLMSRDIRQATNVLSINTNLPIKSLTLGTYTGTITYTWDSTAGVLKTIRSNAGVTTTQTNLTGCDQWSFTLYQRTPTANYVFYTTTDLNLCKLVEMSWRCTRKTLTTSVNREEITTAQVVIRNMNVKVSN
jgi:prepilin-type N-terminal cleavage/methylation domain-containing protein